MPVGGCVTNDGEDVCNGRGVCSNSTSPARTCECYDGFRGITCELRECPLVRNRLLCAGSGMQIAVSPFGRQHCSRAHALILGLYL